MDDMVLFPDSYLHFSTAKPITWKPEGMRFVASFNNPVEQLKVRNGRLIAKVDGMWHIVEAAKP